MNTKPEALRLADLIDPNGVCLNNWRDLQDAAAELRCLHEANEKFAQRQEWWNERMFELEKQRDELLEALKLARLMLIAHGETHAKIDEAIKAAEENA